MPSDNEQVKHYVTYKGDICEYVGKAVIFGKTYYDIIVNGVRKTVSASECAVTKKSNQN